MSLELSLGVGLEKGPTYRHPPFGDPSFAGRLPWSRPLARDILKSPFFLNFEVGYMFMQWLEPTVKRSRPQAGRKALDSSF